MPEKAFSCEECGETFLAATPDDLYTIASREEVSGSVQREYECESCGHINKIYWR